MQPTDVSRSSDARRWPPTVAALTSVGLLGLVGLLGACGGGSEQADESKAQSRARDNGVASVEGADKGGSPSAQVEQPLIRPDTSEEEQDRLWQVYYDCLEQHGLRMSKNKDGSYRGLNLNGQEKQAAAEDKCRQKEPETLPIRAAREDPEYGDKRDHWLKCLKSHGIEAIVEGGMLAFEKGLPPADKIKWIKYCETEAFVVK
ncbi:hypothetical protein [Streptomyces sp. DSM 40484]|uniref:hypothetical protein n=1 Tax=Streptomyces kroppenstedtii TaxID=3051181 RepID=UPI0028D09343|nr:hypothetical protein [Streptomyces sp. DSM 40484]